MTTVSKNSQPKPKKHHIQHWRIIGVALAAYDYLAVLASYTLALLIRFDFVFSSIPRHYLAFHEKAVIVYGLFVVLVYGFFHLYRSMWRFASYI